MCSQIKQVNQLELMNSEDTIDTLSSEGLQSFQRLQPDAVKAVTERFYSTYQGLYQRFGEKGKQSCSPNSHIESHL